MLKNIIKKQGGFTLLELLIVIVIIGILALLIIPNITSAPKKARDTQRKTDLKAVQKGLEEYFVSNNVYPTQATAVAADTALTALTTGSPAIMKTVPKDPNDKGGGSDPHYYYLSAAGTAYTLTACLENGSDTGTDVVAGGSPCASGVTKMFQLHENN